MIQTDAVVIGAGPVGLFQVFQLGLLGLGAQLIDVLPQVGGQCIALYPDKPIYDIPGVPRCTGRELAQLLLDQASPFLQTESSPSGSNSNLHLGDQVETIAHQADGQFLIGTQSGKQFSCKAVFVAAGAGAFVPRSMNLPGLECATNVHYEHDDDLPGALSVSQGQRIVVSGGGEEALSALVKLVESGKASRPGHVALLHRRNHFQAEPSLVSKVTQWIDEGVIDLITGMATGASVEHGQLLQLEVLNSDSQTTLVPVDHLWVRLGLSPKLGPLSDWGLALERKQVPVAPHSFESHVPGIYAVGDINTYPGKKRLILCGFHEATLAAHDANAKIKPEQAQHLQYTTTSALLQQRLGV